MTESLNFFWDRLVAGSWKMVVLSLFFALVSLIFKRRKAFEAGKKAAREVRLNLVYFFIDFLALAPLLVIWVDLLKKLIRNNDWILFPDAMQGWPVWIVFLLALFVSDFVSYWRHRVMHTIHLWPVHAIHHSDTQLTWLGLVRFHPLNRFIANTLNIGVLTIFGFPPLAVVINSLVRHYYGFFIHADIPFTYGPLRYVFVSPRMHRWHHLKEVEGAGSNFTTVFSFIDVIFGTFYLPKKEVGPLGIRERDFPNGWIGQFFYPFKVWGRSIANVLKIGETPSRIVD